LQQPVFCKTSTKLPRFFAFTSSDHPMARSRDLLTVGHKSCIFRFCKLFIAHLMHTDDLHNLKDDMTAFIEGHGMRRFPGYIGEENASVLWKDDDNPDAWKDFVELAKASGAPFVTMDAMVLSKEDLEFVIERLKDGVYTEDLEDARWLRTYIGKTGFLQLGFAHQGTLFLYEVSTEWYDRYQRVLETAEAIGGLLIEDDDDDE
jgi:hypothetical protein